jgi:hypothetical protein
MKKTMRKLEKEIRDLGNEEGMEKLIHCSYGRLADGSRRPYSSRKINPEQAEAIRRAFC